MKKDTGKKEAGNFPKHNTLIMIVSIVTISLFVGLAVQPAIAQKEPAKVIPTNIEECITCKAAYTTQTKLPCTTCSCAVKHAIWYALNYTKNNVFEKMKETDGKIYSGFFTDLSLWIADGIVLGIKDSKFYLDVNITELIEVINNTIHEKISIPEHDLAKIVAALEGVLEGVAEYLMTLCNGGSSKAVYETTVEPIIPPPVKSIVTLKNLLSLCSKAQTRDVCHRCKNIEQIISYNGNGPISRLIFVILKRISA